MSWIQAPLACEHFCPPVIFTSLWNNPSDFPVVIRSEDAEESALGDICSSKGPQIHVGFLWVQKPPSQLLIKMMHSLGPAQLLTPPYLGWERPTWSGCCSLIWIPLSLLHVVSGRGTKVAGGEMEKTSSTAVFQPDSYSWELSLHGTGGLGPEHRGHWKPVVCSDLGDVMAHFCPEWTLFTAAQTARPSSNQAIRTQGFLVSGDGFSKGSNQSCSSSKAGCSHPSSFLSFALVIPVGCFSGLALLTFRTGTFFVMRGCAVHRRMLSSISYVHHLDASSTTPHPVITVRNISRRCIYPLGGGLGNITLCWWYLSSVPVRSIYIPWGICGSFSSHDRASECLFVNVLQLKNFSGLVLKEDCKM